LASDNSETVRFVNNLLEPCYTWRFYRCVALWKGKPRCLLAIYMKHSCVFTHSRHTYVPASSACVGKRSMFVCSSLYRNSRRAAVARRLDVDSGTSDDVLRTSTCHCGQTARPKN